MLNFEPFAIGEGGLTEAVAWTWLVVYVALPPLTLVVFVLQERAGGAGDAVAFPLRDRHSFCWAASRPSSALGLALLVDWAGSSLVGRGADATDGAIHRAWLVTCAAGFSGAFCANATGAVHGSRSPAATTTALLLVSAIWLRDSFDDGAATALYLVLFSALLLTLVFVAVVEERRAREPSPVKQVLPRARGAPGAGP
jgi:hypothetical protein